MPFIPLFGFTPGIIPDFRRCSDNEYSDKRKHKDRQIKDRSSEAPIADYIDALRFGIKDLPVPRAARDDSLRRALLAAFPYRLLLRKGYMLKIFSYNGRRDLRAASRGTSLPNTVCVTDGMGPCIAVAIGGENVKENEFLPGAKIRVFHIFTQNVGALDDVRRCIDAMVEKKLTVKVAMTGGNKGADSRALAANLRQVFSETKVKVEFDRAVDSEFECKLRAENGDENALHTPLAAVIHDHHRVQLSVELVQETDPN
jgi:hypothetical protein